MEPLHPGWRTLVRLSGDRSEQLRRAREMVDSDALWVSRSLPDAVWAGSLRRMLGRTIRTVVLDLAGGPQADALGIVGGLIQGGGRLVLLDALEPDPALAVWPWTVADVGTRMAERMQRPFPSFSAGPQTTWTPSGSREQAELVDRLRRRWQGPPSLTVLTAARGRGKSTALALALEGFDAAVTGPDPAATAEIRERTGLPHHAPDALAEGSLLVVDEAAGLSVPLLEAIRTRHPNAHLVFASTTHGYEGHGRGFTLKFGARLDGDPRPVHREVLRQPIRWAPGDPLERWIHEVLAADARPARRIGAEPLVLEHWSRDRLAADEAGMRQLFGLLVEAHYRTTPSDLHRMLDAPNLRVHVATRGPTIVGANLLAWEGAFDAERIHALGAGERPRGQVLPDTLYSHSGVMDALGCSMVRSVRLAVHSGARRQGVAGQLIALAHSLDADLFGTVFGATPAVLGLRRAHGYRIIRVGNARGARSGCPTAVMLREGTPSGEAWVSRLRAEFARDWTVQRARVAADRETLGALGLGLPEPPAWTLHEAESRMLAWLTGNRPFETIVPALVWMDRTGRLPQAPSVQVIRSLIQGRQGWSDVAAQQGLPSISSAMRWLRRETRALWLPDDVG